MSRYLPPKGTAGLARSAVSGARRLPSPPARTIPNTSGISSPSQRLRHELLGLGDDPLEGLVALEALGVDLVDVLGARWARGEPRALGHDLDPADRRAVAGRLGQDLADRLAGELLPRDLLGGELGEHRLLLRVRRGVDAAIRGAAEALGQRLVALARIVAARGHLGRQQARDEPVLVGRPRAAVAPQEGGARALLAAEAQAPLQQSGDEPLEAHGDLEHAPAQVGAHAVDDRARDERLAHGRAGRPVARAAEEV